MHIKPVQPIPMTSNQGFPSSTPAITTGSPNVQHHPLTSVWFTNGRCIFAGDAALKVLITMVNNVRNVRIWFCVRWFLVVVFVTFPLIQLLVSQN